MIMEIHITSSMLKGLKRGQPLLLSAEEMAVVEFFEYRPEVNEFFMQGKWKAAPIESGVCEICLGTEVSCTRFCDDASNSLIIDYITGDCWLCESRKKSKCLLPNKFEDVHCWDLEPDPKLVVPVEYQQMLIDQITGINKEKDLYGHSVLFGGPPQYGKTHLANALLTRMVKEYLALGFPRHYRLPIYRINAPDWTDTLQSWDTRDTKAASQSLKPCPHLSTVLRFCYENASVDCLWAWEDNAWLLKQFPPVLLFEEICKFAPTEYKTHAVFTLMNRVFESGGMIISTTNLILQR